MLRQLISFLFLLSAFGMYGQSNAVADSLEAVLKTKKDDTSKVTVLNALGTAYSTTDLKKTKDCCNKAIELATRFGFYQGRSLAYMLLGNALSDGGKSDEALKYYFLSVKDKERIHDEKGLATAYNNIGIVYKSKSDHETALKYYALALGKRERLNDKKGIADSYNNMGNVYRSMSLYSEALSAFNKALAIRETIHDQTGIAFALANIGGIYDDQSDFIHALKNNYLAAGLLEKEKKKNPLIRVYNNIGVLNKKLKNYPEALKYSKLSLALSEETGNRNFRVNSYENLGNVYTALKKFGEASSCFEKGIELARESGKKELESAFCAGLALCYENEGRYDLAETSFKKAIGLAGETGIERDVARFSVKLAGMYGRLGKNELAEPLFATSIRIAKKNGLKNDLKKAYKAAADFYGDDLHDLPKSIQYYKLYCALSDSLYADDIVQQFAEQQTKYETKKKESEIRILKQQEEINSLQLKDQQLLLDKRKYLLVASLAFILLLVVSAYVYFSAQRRRVQQRQETLIRETEENERMRLAKDIHDDLGSGLSKIKFLSELVAAKAGDNKDIRSGINTVSETAVVLVENMRDLIWALNPENTTLESLVVRIREYSSDYLNDFPLELRFKITEQFRDRKISKEAHRNIFFILKECLHNLVKHAEATVVTIEVSISNHNFYLDITDDGKGLAEKMTEKGNGLRNIRQRAEMIGSTVNFVPQQNRGLSVILDVPLKNIEKT